MRKCVRHIIHEGKAHGINDVIQRVLEDPPALLIVPDAGSNDHVAQEVLNKNKIKIGILDHHSIENDFTNENTVVINIQITNYENKNLTGAGVTWKFCQAYDQIFGYDFANEFSDLAAIGDIGDMADYRNLEIRSLANYGLLNLNNKFYKGLANTNDYSIQKMNGLNYYSCAFYIIPFINALCRSGTMEEKELVFRSTLDLFSDILVPSSKRGEKNQQTPMWQEAITVAQRVKRRQKEQQDETVEIIRHKIESEKLTDNAVLAVVLDADKCPASLCGLVANKLQAKYQHPSMVLRKLINQETGQLEYSGSLRNYSNCEIQDFAGLCKSTHLPSLVAGHPQAAGFAIDADKFNDFISKTNKLYKDIEFKPIYHVDYIWNPRTINAKDILQIGKLDVYGQNMPESLVAIENVPLSEENLTLMGKNKNTIKISLDKVSMMLFNTNEETFNSWVQGDKYITVIGKPNVNEWQGTEYPQVIIEDYHVYHKESQQGYFEF